MKRWQNKDIEQELKVSKRQNLDERYDYLCRNFNAIVYCMYLERYTNQLKKKIKTMESKNEN